MIQLAIILPITIRILTLILNPLLENEKIEVGSAVGRIEDIGYFFSKVKTERGEASIPNVKLIAAIIKGLNPATSRDKVGKEIVFFVIEVLAIVVGGLIVAYLTN